MQKLPKITVITPTHNRPVLLREAMLSVLSSGYSALQYVVVDDASGSETVAVVNALMEEYPDVITYLRNEKNLGESGSINRGWKIAEGEYISTLSDDDVLEPEWFERSVKFMEAHPDVIVGYPDWYMIDGQGRKFCRMNMPEFDFVNLLTGCESAPGVGTIIRASALEGLKEMRPMRYRFIPDYAMWVRLATRGRLARIPHATACWRTHPQSITSITYTQEKADEILRVTEDFIAEHTAFSLVTDNAPRMRTRALMQCALLMSRARRFIKAAGYLLKAFRMSPLASGALALCYVRRNLPARIKVTP